MMLRCWIDSFTHGSEIISNMENVVAALFARAKNMTSKTETTGDDKEKAKGSTDTEEKKATDSKKQ